MIKLDLNEAKYIIEEFLNKEISHYLEVLGGDHPYVIDREERTIDDVQKAFELLIQKDVF